jgi:hypothetical protein
MIIIIIIIMNNKWNGVLVPERNAMNGSKSHVT